MNDRNKEELIYELREKLDPAQNRNINDVFQNAIKLKVIDCLFDKADDEILACNNSSTIEEITDNLIQELNDKGIYNTFLEIIDNNIEKETEKYFEELMSNDEEEDER